MADKMMVPIFHRVPKRGGYNKDVELWPSYVIITREQSKNIDEILRKALGRVATMTSRDFLTEGVEEQDNDAVIMTEDDTESNVDTRVNAQSIESEDDMVDVSMKQDTNVSKTPSILEPGTDIPEAFRTLFEMRYLPAGQEMVPTGWQSIDGHKAYPTLMSRLPKPRTQPPPTQSSDVSSSQSPTATPGTSDMEDEAEFSNPQPSIEPSSDHESDLPPLD